MLTRVLLIGQVHYLPTQINRKSNATNDYPIHSLPQSYTSRK